MRFFSRICLLGITVLLANFFVASSALPTAKAADLGATDFNLALNLAGLAQRSASVGSLNCSDGSRTFSSTTDMMLGLATDTRVQTQLSLNCKPALNINSGVQVITGTMTIPSKGVTDGVVSAECSARGNMAVTANVTVGAAVAGLLSINVSSASSPLAFGCSFKGSSASKATEVFGTIEGHADVTGMCSSACVAVSLTAKATVTSGTGELKGQTGSGTYTYSDAFELPELAGIADQLASMKGTKRTRDQRVSCPEGATDCSTYDTSPCPNGEDSCTIETTSCPPGVTCTSVPFVCPPGATCTTIPPRNASDSQAELRLSNSRPLSQMRVDLRSGAGDVVIVRPMPETANGIASLNSSQPLTISGPPSAKCVLTLVGRKSVKRTLTLSENGASTIAYSAVQIGTLTRQLGFPAKAKSKPTITASVTCTVSAGALPAKSRKLILG